MSSHRATFAVRSARTGRGKQLLAVIVAVPLVMQAAPGAAQTSSPEAQGHIDRQAYDLWMSGLSGDQRAGAQYWESQRSTSRPISCLGMDKPAQSDFVSGCQEAQRRLALPDVRRRTEHDYRTGWNAPVTPGQASTSQAANPPQAISPPQTTSPPQNASPPQLASRPPPASPPQTPASRDPDAVQQVNTDDWKLLNQPKLKLASKAIGLKTGEIVRQTGADCSGGEYCEYLDRDAPQQYCPALGACRTLTLIVADDKVVGYTADFSLGPWSRSLEAAKAAFGEPAEKTMGSADASKMRKQYWDWSLPGGTKLSFVSVSASDAPGDPSEVHSIFIAPM